MGLSRDDDNSLRKDFDFYRQFQTHLTSLCDPLLSPNKHYIMFFLSRPTIVHLSPLNVFKRSLPSALWQHMGPCSWLKACCRAVEAVTDLSPC